MFCDEERFYAMITISKFEVAHQDVNRDGLQ